MSTVGPSEFLRELPKGDPHIHFEGTVSLETLHALAKKNGIRLDEPTLLAPYPPIPPPNPYHTAKPFTGSFPEFIRLYVKISSCIRSVDDFCAVAEAYIERAREENVRAVEMYFTPSTFLGFGIDLATITNGLLAAQKAFERSNIGIGWIFDIVRNSPARGETTVETAIELRSKGISVVSVGLAGHEHGHPSAPFTAAIARARQNGFRIYAHAGETSGADSIKETIDCCRPERIGHGVRAIESEEILGELRDRRLTLEICPWSNIALGIFEAEDHPVAELYSRGLDIVIGSDDPGIFGRSLTENYLLAHERGISLADLAKVAKRSIEVSSN